MDARPGTTVAAEVAGSSDAPLACVVVPTHARPERLARLLDSLAAQSLDPALFEVVVIDDGSPPERTPHVPAGSANVRLIRQPRQGPAAARNRGARVAAAPLLLFVDDDCTVDRHWIEAFVAAHRDSPRALLGGRTVNGLPDNPCSDAAEGLLGFLDDEALARGGALGFVASNNIACARADFEALGGFDADYPLAAGEDRAFCRSWLEAGGTVERVPAARAAHFHALDLPRFWRQQHNYGRGAARFHAGRASPDEAPPGRATPAPPAFYLRLLLHPLARRDRSVPRRLLTASLVALSQVAVSAGLLAERRAMRGAARGTGGPSS